MPITQKTLLVTRILKRRNRSERYMEKRSNTRRSTKRQQIWIWILIWAESIKWWFQQSERVCVCLCAFVCVDVHSAALAPPYCTSVYCVYCVYVCVICVYQTKQNADQGNHTIQNYFFSFSFSYCQQYSRSLVRFTRKDKFTRRKKHKLLLVCVCVSQFTC